MSDAPERRKDDPRIRQVCDDVASMKTDIALNATALADLKLDVSANTEITSKIHESTKGLVEFLGSSSAAFSLFNKIMSSLRWFLRRIVWPFVIVFVFLYALSHGGRLPEWLKSFAELFR